MVIHGKDARRLACKDFEQDLILYYYGECGREELERIEAHLPSCSSCQDFLKDLRRLLPLTVKTDEPPRAFWDDYSRAMRRRLQAAEQKKPWWEREIFSFLRPWQVPALATALVLILALTLTFTKRYWHPQDQLSEEQALLEILPMAENLEFFKTMELLDSMELLEAWGGSGNGSA